MKPMQTCHEPTCTAIHTHLDETEQRNCFLDPFSDRSGSAGRQGSTGSRFM